MGLRHSYVLRLALVAAVYTASGKLGLHLAFATRSVTAIWPPTGIALAALVVGGYRLWPGVALGALLTNIDTGVPAGVVLGIVCGNTLEAIAGAFLLRRFAGFRPSLERVSDVFALVFLGAVISTTVSATIGVTTLLADGAISTTHLASVWRTWWLGDMGGDLIVAPALLVALTRRDYARLPGRPIEALALTLLLGGSSAAVFSQSASVVYTLFPLLIWAALRFWQPGAAFASLVAASVAVAFTANGQGPFATNGPDARLLLAQTFVSVCSIAALVLAAVTSERRRAEDAERDIAETLQQSLLPDTAPSIPGWGVATFYRAAGAAEVHVGGDFYDFFPTDAGWMLILGDVTGKGVEAAAMAALVRNGARFISQAEHGPAAILARLNEALRERRTLSLCSAVCVRLHADHLLLSSAGHPPPLIVRRDGRIREIGGGGPILGADSTASWPERRVPVEPGETVLLYTDGVTDTRGATERFGVRRLRELLLDNSSCSPAELLAEVKLAVEDFQVGPQADDTAALTLGLEQPRVGSPRSDLPLRAPAVAAPVGATALDGATAKLRGPATIEASGEIDHMTAPQLLGAFAQTSCAPESELVLDLTRVTFVDSVGLRTLIAIERRAAEVGIALRVIAPPPEVRTVFRLSGLEGSLRFAQPEANGSPDTDYADRVELRLAADDEAPKRARAEVREALGERLSPADADVAVLLTSELVTNAVLHPVHPEEDVIGLRISCDIGRARVEVADSGRGFDPAAVTRRDKPVGGLGLHVVDRGALRWGTTRDERFTVWFELA